MLIFGFRVRRKIHDLGWRSCPVCRTEAPMQHNVYSRWFTLFFVPIFPIGRVGEDTLCVSCGTQFRPDAPVANPANSLIGATHSTRSSQDAGPVAGGPVTGGPVTGGPVTGGPVTGGPVLGIQNLSNQGFSAHSHPPRNMPPRTSALAVVSLILGVLSLPTCLCMMFFPATILTIVLGHLGLAEIRKSNGLVTGRGMAIGGLTAGYLSLVLTLVGVGLTIWSVANSDRNANRAPEFVADAAAASNLQDAETIIFSDKDGVLGHGNSPRAQELATEFAADIMASHSELFEVNRERVLQLSKGKFLTYCQLNEQSCCFLVHVPSYRDYTQEAKEVLAEIAWLTAAKVAAKELSEGDSLAVGLRGTFLYGDVMVGELSVEGDGLSDYRSAKRDDLLRYFEESLQTPSFAELSLPSDRELALEVPNQSDLTDSIPVTGEIDAMPDPALGIPPGFGADPLRPDSLRPDSLSPDSFEPPFNVTPFPPPPSPRSSTPRSEPATSVVPAELTPPETLPTFENAIDIQLHRIIENKSWSIKSMAFSPDARHLAVGRLDSTLSVYDVASGDSAFATKRIDELGQVTALAFSKDGKHLLAGGYSGLTAAWRIADDGSLSDFTSRHRLSNEVTIAATSPSFDFGIAGSRRGELAWQPFSGDASLVRINQSLSRSVLAIHLPTQGTEALAASESGWLRFNLRDGAKIEEGTWDERSTRATAVAIASDGSQLALLKSQKLEVFDITRKQTQTTFEPLSGERWHSVAWHPSRRWLVVGSDDRAVVFDCETTDRVAQLEMPDSSRIENLVFDREGNWLAAAGGNAGRPIHLFKFPKP